MRVHSLKWRIQLWHAVILAFVLGMLGTGFYYYERSHRISQVDQSLDEKIHRLLGPTLNRGGRGPGGGGGGERRAGQEGPRNRQVLSEAQGWEMRETDMSQQAADQESRDQFYEAFEAYYAPQGMYAIVYDKRTLEPFFKSSNFPDMDIPSGNVFGYYQRFNEGRREILHGAPRYSIIIGSDMSGMQASLNRLKLEIASVVLVIFGLGVSIGSWLVSRSLRPLNLIQETAARISDGKLSARIPDSAQGSSEELDALANDLNETFARLESLFERQIRFTADASHELRTPLTSLLAQIQRGLNRSRTPEEYQRILEVCSRSGERIKRITEQLIELSRYDSGRVELEYEDLPVDGMLEGLAEELEPYVLTHGCELKTDLAPGVIHCDPFRLEQVITNLINNAIQHNDTAISITLRSRVEKDRVLIQVIDTGKGIQPENLDKLFDRFFQESTSRTKSEGRSNVGLGLAISLAIVQAHGGSLTAASKPWVETVFTIEIPADPLGQGAAPRELASAAISGR